MVVAHIFNPSTRKAEAHRFLLSSRPAWPTERVSGEPGLLTEKLYGLSEERKKRKNFLSHCPFKTDILVFPTLTTKVNIYLVGTESF